MCDDLRSVWFCICVLRASLRGPRGAVGVLGAFVGTANAIEMVSRQRAIVELLNNERRNEFSTYAFSEEYRAVTEGLRRLYRVNIVEETPITMGALQLLLSRVSGDWQAFRFIVAGVFAHAYMRL